VEDIMQLRKTGILPIILAIFSLFTLSNIEMDKAFATTISPKITYSSNREYVLKVKETRNNKIIFFCYKKRGSIDPHAKLVVYSPSGRKYIGTQIYRHRAVYLFINPSTGNYRAILYANNSRISFPAIKISSNTSHNYHSTQKAKIFSVKYYPHEIDLGKTEKPRFRVLVKTNSTTTKVLLKAKNTHTFRLIRNTGSYKLWEWDWTPPLTEVDPLKSETKKMSVIAYTGRKPTDEKKISLFIKNSRYSIDLPFKGTYKVTQGNFGNTSHYDHGIWDNTYAIDFGMPKGTPIYAPTDGKIVRIYDEKHGGCIGGGRVLVLKDIKGNYITFLHLQKIVKNVGNYVRRGELIAYSGGSSGKASTGICYNNGYPPHLHIHLWNGKGRPDSHTTPFTKNAPIRAKLNGKIVYLYGESLKDSNIAGKYLTSLLH
jgi:murein DD-endopeptidase MepM/ murein hydrolase activator NlpD